MLCDSVRDAIALQTTDLNYGSASKIIKKNWKVAALASDMARGFCAWFILQHLRGYKPFITKITFEKEFSGTLNIEKEKPNRLQRETLNERI